jgi:hypothetical protein
MARCATPDVGHPIYSEWQHASERNAYSFWMPFAPQLCVNTQKRADLDNTGVSHTLVRHHAYKRTDMIRCTASVMRVFNFGVLISLAPKAN